MGQVLAALRKAAVGLAKPFVPAPNSFLGAISSWMSRASILASMIVISQPMPEIMPAASVAHFCHVADADLKRETARLCTMLADEGLRINRSKQRELVTYLGGVNVKSRVTLVRRTGRHEIAMNQVFVLPNETIGPRGAEQIIFHASATGPYEAKGSLQGWQDSIGALASGHALPVLAISAAFAGPLLHLAGQEGGGFDFHGMSSKGKTTLLQMAASVWGKGTTPGYVRAWRATANGLEGRRPRPQIGCSLSTN
jgi:hypothetical protein